MKIQLVKEILLNNIVAKESLLRRTSSALFILRRDFIKLKAHEQFPTVLNEILEISKQQLRAKESLENTLKEVNVQGTLYGIAISELDTDQLIKIAGSYIQIENCGEQESALENYVDNLLSII